MACHPFPDMTVQCHTGLFVIQDHAQSGIQPLPSCHHPVRYLDLRPKVHPLAGVPVLQSNTAI